MKAMLFLLLLAGCCAVQVPPEAMALPEPPIPPPAAVVPAPAVAAPATPATVATRDYRAVERAIPEAITSKAASADYITNVVAANKRARKAVTTLVTQQAHPTPEAISEARRTRDELIKALGDAP